MIELKAMLALHEGNKSHVYTDPNGLEHIGVGRNISKSGLGLAPDEIDLMLDNDIIRCMRECANAFPFYATLDGTRQDVLVMMCFNLGMTRLRKFTKMLEALEKGDYAESKVQALDSLWATQVGQRAVTLATMLETGVYPNE